MCRGDDILCRHKNRNVYCYLSNCRLANGNDYLPSFPNVGLCIEIETLNIRYVVFGLQVIHIAQCKPFGYGTGKRVLHISVLSNGSTGDNCALNVLPAPEAMPKLLLRFL